MTRRLPSLSALRAFEAAGRHLSFTMAARELNVTQTAISHQVKALEDDLDLMLFVRRPRGLSLTDVGRAYLMHLTEAFQILQRATDRISRQGRDDTVTVTVLPSFAAKWLVPRLLRFRERSPSIDVRLSASTQLIDFARSDVELGVRFGRGAWPDTRAELLMREVMVLVCSPALAAGEPPLRTVEDLRHHTLLHSEWFGGDRYAQWRAWLAALGIEDIPWHRGPVFSDASHSIQAAIEGQGVALGRSVLIADDLAAGRLVVPFVVPEKEANAYYVVSAEGVPDRPAVASFRAWLHEEADAARKETGPANRPRGEKAREEGNAIFHRRMKAMPKSRPAK